MLGAEQAVGLGAQARARRADDDGAGRARRDRRVRPGAGREGERSRDAAGAGAGRDRRGHRASRDVELDGVDVRKGAWLGLADGRRRCVRGRLRRRSSDAVVERLLDGEPRAPHDPHRGRTHLTVDGPASHALGEPRIPGSRSRCTTAASRTTRCCSQRSSRDPIPCFSSTTTTSTARRSSCSSAREPGLEVVAVADGTPRRAAAVRRARGRRRADGLPAARPDGASATASIVASHPQRSRRVPHGGGDRRRTRGGARRRCRRASSRRATRRARRGDSFRRVTAVKVTGFRIVRVHSP